MIEALLLILSFYLFMGLSSYIYLVFKYYEITGDWNFNIKDGYVCNIFKYPKWLLFWIEWIMKKFKRG